MGAELVLGHPDQDGRSPGGGICEVPGLAHLELVGGRQRHSLAGGGAGGRRRAGRRRAGRRKGLVVEGLVVGVVWVDGVVVGEVALVVGLVLVVERSVVAGLLEGAPMAWVDEPDAVVPEENRRPAAAVSPPPTSANAVTMAVAAPRASNWRRARSGPVSCDWWATR